MLLLGPNLSHFTRYFNIFLLFFKFNSSFTFYSSSLFSAFAFSFSFNKALSKRRRAKKPVYVLKDHLV